VEKERANERERTNWREEEMEYYCSFAWGKPGRRGCAWAPPVAASELWPANCELREATFQPLAQVWCALSEPKVEPQQLCVRVGSKLWRQKGIKAKREIR